MSKLRYNRVFKKGIGAFVFCILLFGSIIAFFIAAKVQYNDLVADMKKIEATIVDIDLDIHIKGPDEQEIYVTYEVDGITYERELKTDTKISFTAGTGANYSVGDKIEIFYDSENPEIIASPRSMSVGYFWLAFACLSLALVVLCFFWMIKHRRKFLVTQEEYDKEKEEAKATKKAEREEKKKRKAERKNKHPYLRKIGKIVLIVLCSIVGAFILFLLFGGFLKLIGY